MQMKRIRGTLPGIRGEHSILVLEGDTHIGRWIEEAKRLDHDQNALPLIGKLITDRSIVWDVGAYIGDHTAFYASRAKHVVAFEAAPDAFACLTYNTRYYANVTCLNLGVGDGTPAADLLYNCNYGARSLFPSVLGAPTFRLDDWMWSQPADLIKLDIEGWEVLALQGAERMLLKYHPILVCEVNEVALERVGFAKKDLHAILTDYRYVPCDLYTNEPWHPDDPRPQFDVVCR